MASLRTNLLFHHSFSSLSPELRYFRTSILSRGFSIGKVRIFTFRSNRLDKNGRYASSCLSRTVTEIEKVSPEEERLRPPFDINLAVVLAGFAFEAYTSPPESVGRREVDGAGCKTVYLSESFVREIYDGQLFIKLKKGLNLPAMDLWGTSDPYVVLQLDGQVLKSNVKWGSKEPTWNEEFIFNIKEPQTKNIKIAAWDANLVTPHKRMGNARLSLESISDGKLHEVLVELEGMGGGGKLQLEVRYKTFGEIEEDKIWWRRVPFISEFLNKNGFDSAVNMLASSKTVQVRQFVEYAFAQMKSFNDVQLWTDQLLSKDDIPSLPQNAEVISIAESSSAENNSDMLNANNNGSENEQSLASLPPTDGEMDSDNQFWTNLTDIINQNLVQQLGYSVSDKLKWDGFEPLNKIGLEARKMAEVAYVESGLAVPESSKAESKKQNPFGISIIQPPMPVPNIKKATDELLKQTESVLGALMVLSATVSQLNKEVLPIIKRDTKDEASTKVNEEKSKGVSVDEITSSEDGPLVESKAEEMKALFSSAESAMEAWAMLSISMGHPSFIKSEFEKICFLDNNSTDSQVAIWRDSSRRRLVVAFRGTEQARWKDLVTDLMIVPGGLNPERIGGDFKQEVQVHTGFLNAYDSVRIRIISIIKQAIGFIDEPTEPEPAPAPEPEPEPEPPLKWHVYVTGHSLGGALATLLALELSSSQLAKRGAISVTMYNFGSPRVGNKKFTQVYNNKVKDSWRVVNHRDIIPTVPRLMGYCHVAQPVYLAVGDLKDAMINIELLSDGYRGDVIGESTPDVLVSEFMKGEKELIEKILQTEINIFRSIRDGSALMQHMEDFYYISLLENAKSGYRNVGRPQSEEGGGGITGG